jgi:hypothetical protein
VAGEQLRLRFERGHVVFELEGDAASVHAEIAGYMANGFGRLLDFFAGTGISTDSGQPEDSDAEEETPFEPLTNPAMTLTFAVDRLDVLSEPIAIDLNGDGAPENVWGMLMRGLAQDFGFDPQGAIDQALAAMAPVPLFRITTTESDLTVDQRMDVSVTTGQPLYPDRTAFQIDSADPAVTLPGMLRTGRFVSQEPARGSLVATAAVPLPAFPAAGSLVLGVRAPRISFNLAPDGSYITQGRLNGAITPRQFIPAIAAELTAHLAADPQSPAAMFDTGGCTNPDGTPAQAGDGVIDPCELVSNDLFASLMQRDVHLFDDAGHYEPDPNGVGNALSFGVGFTAAPASF